MQIAITKEISLAEADSENLKTVLENTINARNFGENAQNLFKGLNYLYNTTFGRVIVAYNVMGAYAFYLLD